MCSDFGIRPRGLKGASIHLRAITRALSDAGHCVSLLNPNPAPENGHPATALLPDDTCEPLVVAKRLRRWLKDRDLPHHAADELRTVLYNEWAIDKAKAALSGDAPDAIVERLSLFGCVGMELSRRFNCPHVVEVNALLSREAAQYRNLEMSRLAEEIELRVLQQADAVIAVSSELRQMLGSFGIDINKITVVPNGTDMAAFDPETDGASARAELGLNGNFVVGFAGSLKIWHGVDLLITAFAEILAEDDQAKLLIVGTGPVEDVLKKQASLAGIADSVIFTGGVEHSDIPRYLGAMDVAAAPFRAQDDFYFSPIKIFEYMAAGRCVVASQLGQIEEVIADRQTGLLCPPDDVNALAEALLSALRDPNLRRDVGAAARQRVANQYTWQAAAKTTSDVIARAVANR